MLPPGNRLPLSVFVGFFLFPAGQCCNHLASSVLTVSLAHPYPKGFSVRSVFLLLQTGKVLVMWVPGGFAKSSWRSWRRNHLLSQPFGKRDCGRQLPARGWKWDGRDGTWRWSEVGCKPEPGCVRGGAMEREPRWAVKSV